MDRHRVLAILLVPAALTSVVASRLEASARTLGSAIARGLPPARADPELFGEPDPIEEDDDDVTDLETSPRDGAPRGLRGGNQGPTRQETASESAPRRARGSSVFVPESAILRLARARIVPEGRPVPANDDRPGGVRLSGVSAMGVGMEDGDVITEVAGRRVRHEGDIVDIVLAARGRHAERLSATFYRGKARGVLVVAMPYPREAP